jgi:carboxymethylenebutenolidase
VVLQEWWGLVPQIIDVAERLAREGFVVLAPDLYHGETTTEPDVAAKKLMALDLPRAAQDIAGAARYLLGREDTTGTGAGAIGFCMGGSLALWAGALVPEVVAAVPFYPAIPFEKLGLDWSAYAGKAVQMHLAEGDGGSGTAGIQDAKTGLEGAGAAVTLYDYAGTGHAFFNDVRPDAYDADAAALAWQRTVSFLHERLG